MKFYLVVDAQREGPFAPEELTAHGLERDSLVWCAGLNDWTRADKVPALQEIVATIPPPLPAYLLSEASREPRADQLDAPSTFRRLHKWWAVLFALTFLMPLFGGVSLLMAEMEYGPVGSGRVRYYRYSEVGYAMLVLGGVSIGLGPVALIAAIIVFAILLHKMWKVVQDGQARTTPEKAVGFLFIPFFNVYWAFVAIHGLALDLNSYVRRHRACMDGEPAPTALSLVFCILFAIAIVPYLNLLVFVPMSVVLFLLVPRLKNSVAGIVHVRQAAEANRSESEAGAWPPIPDQSAHVRPAGLQGQPVPSLMLENGAGTEKGT
jgi:hypothetical protein